MRKYNRRIDVRLTEDEYAVLADKAEKAGVSVAEFFRRLVNDYTFPEKPDPDFVKALINLSNIGNALIDIWNMNETEGSLDREKLEKNIDNLDRISTEIMRKYFSPWK